MAVERGGRRAHGPPHRRNHHLGDGQIQGTLHAESRRPSLDGIGGEVVPVAHETGHAEEEDPLDTWSLR